MESAKNANQNNNVCRDCGKKIVIKEGGEIENGVLLSYDDNARILQVFKCSGCYKISPRLTNFRECEVYSRVVGYIRPVRQWNTGKKEEYKERQEFNAPFNCA